MTRTVVTDGCSLGDTVLRSTWCACSDTTRVLTPKPRLGFPWLLSLRLDLVLLLAVAVEAA